MATARGPAQPSAKLQSILKDFQQIASMAGFLNHAFDLPQLRLFFTLYARLTVADEAAGLALAAAYLGVTSMRSVPSAAFAS